MEILEGVRLKAFSKNAKGEDIRGLNLCKSNPNRFPVSVSNGIQHLFSFEMSFIWSKY